MGWTCTQRPGDVRQHLIDAFTWDTDQHSNRPLDIAIVRLTTAYLAVETTVKATGARYVWAGVVLIRWGRRDDCYGFCTKQMDETVGPCEAECPERILRLLTDGPHLNDWSRVWRQRCWNNVRIRKGLAARVKRWRQGTLLEHTGDGLVFGGSGGRLRRFRVFHKRQQLFTDENGSGLYHIPRRLWHDLAEVADPPASPPSGQAEGWVILARGPHGYQLQRDDTAAVFPSDEEAWRHVAARAREGSLRHLSALRFIEVNAPAERARIRIETGY